MNESNRWDGDGVESSLSLSLCQILSITVFILLYCSTSFDSFDSFAYLDLLFLTYVASHFFLVDMMSIITFLHQHHSIQCMPSHHQHYKFTLIQNEYPSFLPFSLFDIVGKCICPKWPEDYDIRFFTFLATSQIYHYASKYILCW